MLTLPIPVSRALRKLSHDIHDIKDTRRRRCIPTATVAARASISKPTFIRVERGGPTVSIGSYATVLYVLGMGDRLGDLAAPKNDPVGLQLGEENLPQPIRRTGRKKTAKGK